MQRKNIRKYNTRNALHKWLVTYCKNDVSVVLLKDDHFTILSQLINNSELEITGEWWQHGDERSLSIIRESKRQARLALQNVSALILPGSNSNILPTFYDKKISPTSSRALWEYWSDPQTKATRQITKTILNMALLNLAMIYGMPIFGICAGFTALNVFIGNTTRLFSQKEKEEYFSQCIDVLPYTYKDNDESYNRNQLINVTTNNSEFWHFLNSFNNRSELSQQPEPSPTLTTRAYVAHSYVVSPHNIPKTNGYFKRLFSTTAETVTTKNNRYIQAIEQQHGAPVLAQQSHFEVDIELHFENSCYAYKEPLPNNYLPDEEAPGLREIIPFTLEINRRNLKWIRFITSSTTTHYHRQQVIQELSEKFNTTTIILTQILSELYSILDSCAAAAAAPELPEVNTDDVAKEIVFATSKLELPKNMARYHAVPSL